jgi:sulfide dehydrogenase cytochrome subunit
MNPLIKATVGIALAVSAVWASAADVLQVRGMAAACASCHGTHGVALPGMESLAGQPKEDLLKKMLDFKSGKKPATLMHQLSKGYTDEQLEQMAGYFAALKK